MCDPEVQEAHETVLAEEDVGRLEVTVDDPVHMNGAERAGQITGDRERGVDVQGSLASETILEVFAIEELGDQAGAPVGKL